MPKKKYWWIEDDEQNELLARKFKVNNFLNDDAYTNLADNYKEDAKIWQMFKIYKNHLMAMYEKVVPLFLTLHVGDKKVTKFADLNNFNYSPLSAQQRKQTLEEVKSLADSVRQLERNFNAAKKKHMNHPHINRFNFRSCHNATNENTIHILNSFLSLPPNGMYI